MASRPTRPMARSRRSGIEEEERQAGARRAQPGVTPPFVRRRLRRSLQAKGAMRHAVRRAVVVVSSCMEGDSDGPAAGFHRMRERCGSQSPRGGRLHLTSQAGVRRLNSATFASTAESTGAPLVRGMTAALAWVHGRGKRRRGCCSSTDAAAGWAPIVRRRALGCSSKASAGGSAARAFATSRMQASSAWRTVAASLTASVTRQRRRGLTCPRPPWFACGAEHVPRMRRRARHGPRPDAGSRSRACPGKGILGRVWGRAHRGCASVSIADSTRNASGFRVESR